MTAIDTAPAAGVHRVTFRRVLIAEWIKFRTLRSTVWALGLTVVMIVGFAALMSWAATLPQAQIQPGGLGAGDLVTVGSYFGQLIVAVLGVLTISGEYSTGMIRSTLLAAPRRLPVLWGKAAVLAVVVAVVSLVAVALATLVTLPFHDQLGITLDLGDSETLRILLGVPAYLTAVSLLGLAFGALLRHSAGAIATVLGLLLVVENVIGAIPLAFFEQISPFLPATAGGKLLMNDQTLALLAAASPGVDLAPWQGYAVMLAWVAALLAGAAVLLRRRDA